MAKITLDDITSSYASTSLFQANFTAIETEFNDKVLYRVNPMGEANQMENNLDMNSNSILNASTINTDVIILNGLPITAGGNATTLTYVSTEFTGVAGFTTFNCDYTVGFLEVFYNGVLLSASDFTALDGTTFTLVDPVAANTDLITCKAYSSFLEADMLQKSLNLSDLSDVPTARTNLGLGTAALVDHGTASTEVPLNSDLGSASLVDTGTGATQVPTNADVRNPRNRIVNPSMAISQENGFVDSVVPAGTYYIADQYATSVHASSGCTLDKSYHVLDGSKSFRMTVDTAATDLSGSINVGRIQHKIEKSNALGLDGGNVVLSFTCQTNWAGKLSIGLINGDATKTFVTNLDVVAGVNHLYTVIPFEADTVALESLDNEAALDFFIAYNNEGTFQQPAANNDAWQTGVFLTSDETTMWSKTLGNYVEITNVDLYAGNVPREFQPNSYAYDLAECQRYFERIEGVSGDQATLGVAYGFSTTTVVVPINYTSKRDLPSIILSGKVSILTSAAAVVLCSASTYEDIGIKAGRVATLRDTGTHTAGDVFIGRLDTGVSNYIDINARL